MVSVYILYSKSLNRYYTGITNDLTRRLRQHNSGCTRSITHANDWQIVYQEPMQDNMSARARERAIKARGASRFLRHTIIAPAPPLAG